MSSQYRTQRITEADLAAGRIRIPIGHKALFPSNLARIKIKLRGTELAVPYNPRLGPDRERSGVITVGSILRSLVTAEDVLEVSAEEDRLVLA